MKVLGLSIALGLSLSVTSFDSSNWAQNAPSAPAAQTQVSPTPASAPAKGAAQTPPPPTAPVLGNPPIEFRPAIIDLGTVRPNQQVTGTTYIHNLSDKWLRVAATRANCTCTKVNLTNTMIAPGQAVAMEAVYSSNTVMGETKGLVKVLIEGYDIVEVPVKGFVTMPVRAEPTYVTALGDEPRFGEFDVLSIDQKPFSIVAVNSDPPVFVGFDPAKDQPRNKYRLKWDFRGFNEQTCVDKNGRRLPGWIVVETDHPDCPVFDLEVRHECNRRVVIRGDSWALQEKRILLGGMKAGVPQEFEVLAKWWPNAAKTDAIQTAVTESNRFNVELLGVQPLDEGMMCKIRVTPIGDSKGMVYGTLRVHSQNQSSTLTIIGTMR